MRINLLFEYVVKFLVAALSFVSVSPTEAEVDMRNLNYAVSTFDFCMGPCEGGKVTRTYNSRSQFSGMFGYGWCSDIETTLTDLDGALLFRNCGAGAKVVLRRRNDLRQDPNGEIDATIRAIAAKNPSIARDEKKWAKLQGNIRTNPDVRQEWRAKTGISPQRSFPGEYVSEDGRMVAISKGDGFSVQEGINKYQFNRDGYLVTYVTASGTNWRIKRNPRQIRFDSQYGMWTFTLDHRSLVNEVAGPKGTVAKYQYRSTSRGVSVLSSILDQWGKTKKYEYDTLLNLTRTQFPDGTEIRITYDKEQDWVTSFRDRDQCKEIYHASFSTPSASSGIFQKSRPILSQLAANLQDRDEYHVSLIKTCGSRVKSRLDHWEIYDGTIRIAAASSKNGKESLAVFDKYENAKIVRGDPFFGLEVKNEKAIDNLSEVLANGLVTGRTLSISKHTCHQPQRIQGILGAKPGNGSELFSGQLVFIDLRSSKGGQNFLRDGNNCLPDKLEWNIDGASGTTRFIWIDTEFGRVQLSDGRTIRLRILKDNIETLEGKGICNECVSSYLVDLEALAESKDVISWLEHCADLTSPVKGNSEIVDWRKGVCTKEEKVVLAVLMLYSGVHHPVRWEMFK